MGSEPVNRSRALRLVLAVFCLLAANTAAAQHSVARQWNNQLLEAIRHDLARPTVHARNLFHVSAAMWDAWAAYDNVADGWLVREKLSATDVQAARREAISHAAYRLLRWRFANSPGAATSLASFDAQMQLLGYDIANQSLAGDSPAALGNRIAETYIQFGLRDGSNESNGYVNRHYEPVNPPVIPPLPGNPEIIDPNRYQPLALEYFVDQSGNVIPGGFPEFLSPEWGQVVPFSLRSEDLSIRTRDGFDYWLFHDPGPPPLIGGPDGETYKTTFEQVVRWSGLLDPALGSMIDISPASLGNNTLGTNDGHGYAVNPATGQPYAPEVVPAGDYYRVLAEFWADGPSSETPPGHWFAIANTVSDHPLVIKRIGGNGPVLDDLQWDVKLYLALGGAMHDVAVASWGLKGWYDYIRPISAIRYLADLGQSTDPSLPSWDPDGIHLYPGEIELVTPESTAPGQRHAHLAGPGNSNIGKIAVYAWRGPEYILDPDTDTAGVGWILAENWWPYQRPTFVTPPFAGYISGHSTYSRAAAELMAAFTGDEFFPGGLAQFEAPQNQFLVFEQGPSVDVTLQWAKYADAADECSLSRIYGGIHPPADDIPGRMIGAVIGPEALSRAIQHFQGSAPPTLGIPAPVTELPSRSPFSLLMLISAVLLLGSRAARRHGGSPGNDKI
ncbi:vanadium-dependent haloperoxidase [Dokdonella sp.]|uniref:vanadium-dependent haloperoxidase n=1 Tax=Dokdonella sp. TaxID=2291710 RepID=UPI003C3E5610